MSSPTPSADELDSYDLPYLTQLANDEGIKIGRKKEPGLRAELKAHYAAKAAEASGKQTPKRPVRQAALKKPTTAASSVVETPRKVTLKLTKKRKADVLEESDDEPARQRLDRSSLVGRRVYYTLQHIQTARSELINEDLGDLLKSTIEGLREVVDDLEKIVERG